ncbi:B-cell receptor-associated protein 31-like, partial [Cyanistes caeruleus]|uniref:B-cell receptor-associated protein 31-like n=1 Tax=Cyanistes caeruleus TaxID=156563 RepID=UPI000CDABCEC
GRFEKLWRNLNQPQQSLRRFQELPKHFWPRLKTFPRLFPPSAYPGWALGRILGVSGGLNHPSHPSDALRETRKYSVGEREALSSSPAALEHFHMKLFRAQRNLYLAGFALLLSFLLRRLVTLISAQAALGASSQAFRKQAEGASQAARQYLEDNDALRKQLKESGGAPSPSRDENETLKAKVESLKEELELSKK